MKFSPTITAGAMSTLPILLFSLSQTGCGRGAQYYLDTGNRLYEGGKYADASINYRKSLQKDPRAAESHYRLGLAELRQGHENDAYIEFRQGTQLAPGRDDIRMQLADVALNRYQASKNKPQILYDEVAGTADYLLGKNPNSFD